MLEEVVDIDYSDIEAPADITSENTTNTLGKSEPKNQKATKPSSQSAKKESHLHSKSEANQNSDQPSDNEWFETKSRLMASFFGEENHLHYFSIIPASAGGNYCMYYYPNSGRGGTSIATKQLSTDDGTGAYSVAMGRYELVIQTRHRMPESGEIKFGDSDFGKANQQLSAVLQTVATYAQNTQLEPFQTIESAEGPHWYGAILLGLQNSTSQQHDFGMMLIVQVHKSELEFARKNGTEKLIGLLEKHSMFPFSDLDRPPVA
ncbi:suppressor of fused domain protein [Grimontia sp. S25]|uniref:Suppressor of fused domain protein n=1 Tax=Grimontia sedimenti TaxID=2711294 RepID=A0A6M1R6V5_9GAMM|nr:suppressor of fused domain protein [Grimontia sedimenti]NGN97873.1 suppressor of fused domain protein [Grimontia sedimenti]